MAAPGAEGLLERDLETAHLQRAVDHASHGVGRVLVIGGPAGIGKTTLLGAARALAHDAGANVRLARGAELEQGFAFGVVRQLFEPMIAMASEAERRDWLSGAAELAAPLFEAEALLADADHGDSVYPRLHGLYWMCANIARTRPLALCVDDAQWADDPSVAFLGYLARRLEELPVLVTLAVRTPLSGAAAPLSVLLDDRTLRVLALRGLSVDGVERMLALQVAGRVEEGFAEACHAATAGNPFLLRELALELHERGIAPTAANAGSVESLVPQRVATAVLTRLAKISPAATPLAQAIAVLGDGAAIGVAAALARLDEQSALAAASAIRAGSLLGEGPQLNFAHPIIRAAVYSSLLADERSIRHGEAAALLHARGALPEQVAAQLLLAGGVEEPWVLEVLMEAARSALILGAPRNAVDYLRRALEVERSEDGRAELLTQLGHAEMLSGLSDAAEHLGDAVRLTADPDERARVSIMLGQLLKFTGRADRAIDVLSGIDGVSDPRVADRVETELLSTAAISNRAHALLSERIEAVQDPGRAARSDRERYELVLLAYEKLLVNRPVSEILDLIARAGAGAGSSDERIVLPPGETTAGAVLIYCDQLDEVAAWFDRVIERSRRRGSLTSLVIGLSLNAEIAYRRGDLAGALAAASDAFELSKEVSAGGPFLFQYPIATYNSAAIEEGRSEPELRDLLQRTDESLDGDTAHESVVLYSRARLLLALGDPRAALDGLLAIGELPHSSGVGAPAFVAWRSAAALVAHQLGDQRAARRLAAEEVELARGFGAARALGIALRAFALVQSPPAVDALEEAISVLERSPARLERARTLVDLGAAIRRAGERAASRARLRDGHDLAVVCGATRLAEHARQEIAASGERVSRGGLHGVESLTPSELRIAELAADGQTNREIAQSLFITQKTVETHLRHVFDKLDIRSRRRLREALTSPEPTPV